uniref:Large ribosomal subunit protein mL42 n=1 Tax=Equus asinus TaxID=9793 RepID=A0A9L0JG06_EQUAS
MALAAVKWAISSRTILKHLFPIQTLSYHPCPSSSTLYVGCLPQRGLPSCAISAPGIRTGEPQAAEAEHGALYCVCHKSTYSSLPDDYNCKVELALTSDGRTIVCYHPSVDIPYEHTKPIPRPDPVHNHEETHDQVLKTRLEEKSEHLEQGPMIEQLSKMFFTTKHRWYPRGQYHRRRKKLDPPKDR